MLGQAAASDLSSSGRVEQTGLEDFGGTSFRDGLDRLVASLDDEADLTELGKEILGLRLRCCWPTVSRRGRPPPHPEIDDEVVEGPLVIIGAPRTGTTALSQLRVRRPPDPLAASVGVDATPSPPRRPRPRTPTPASRRRQRGLDAMYETFPRMSSMHFQAADGATECQDLLGMEFRTAHFDGMAHVPSYTRLGHWTATWPPPTGSTVGCCSSCSGTAPLACGT